tara:strand:+ start:420 stop:866 length:447 start_codon:yes stop_codon:yes gene_type:complete
MTFSLDIKEFAEKTKRDMLEVKVIVAIDLFSRVIMSTPVGNPDLWEKKKAPPGYVGGRLRGNWQASAGSPIIGTIPTIDPSGKETIREMTAELEGVKADQSIFLTNSLPYANRIEYGHSQRQRPEGMVRVNILLFENAINNAIRKVSK